MFYERFLQLCRGMNLAPSAAATQAGFNKGTVSIWKKKFESGIDVVPDQDIIDKICAFFHCSESWLRGISSDKETAPTPSSERCLTDGELMAAFFHGADPNLSEEDMAGMWQDAKNFRDFIVEKWSREKNGQ